MADFIKTQNSFSDGEVAPEFFARDNLNGLSRLENMDVLGGGGLRRRRGLATVAELSDTGRLVPFSVSDTENYLLVLTDGYIQIYQDDEFVTNVVVPWDTSALDKIQYAQRFDTMIFVHPDYPPQVLQKSGTSFQVKQFSFSRNDSDMSVNIPFMRFDDSADIKITVTSNSLGNNFATFTTNQDFWTADNQDGYFMLLGKMWVITDYINATTVYAYTNGTYTLPSDPVTDWQEAAFSDRRGWPCSITFHQDRLVFGGSRSWPGGIWMSRVGQHKNFNVGTGLDDEAIFITLLSQQRQQICTIVSSDTLQILTNVGEWAIASKPVTPSAVDIRQHTSVGSVSSRYLPPHKIEGATVFISAGKQDIRELSLDQLGEHYNATDLCTAAKHLMQDPVDLSYSDATRQLFVVMANGDMAVLNQNSALGISAWGRYKTQGQFKSVATVNGTTYVIVARGDTLYLEKFSADALNDGGTYGFSFTAAAMPLRASGHNATRMKIRKISVRVLDTKTLFINDARAPLPNAIYDDASPGYSGDVSVNVLGTQRNCVNAPWKISSSEQLPTNILSVAIYGYYTV